MNSPTYGTKHRVSLDDESTLTRAESPTEEHGPLETVANAFLSGS